jgi:subtilisin family serine protease
MPYPQRPVEQGPVPRLPVPALTRYRASILDPDAKDDGRRRPNPTAYVHDQLLVQGSADEDALGALIEAAKSTGHDIGTSESSSRKRDEYIAQLGEEALAQMSKRWVTRLLLRPKSNRGSTPPTDAYETLQKYREAAGSDSPLRVGLNHLVTLTSHVGLSGAPYFNGPSLTGSPYFNGPAFGTPYFNGPAFGTPYFNGPGMGAPYFNGPGIPDPQSIGGRIPVTWLGRPPKPKAAGKGVRRPVVAVLDTGLGRHGWLGPEDATLGVTVHGLPIGVGSDVPDPEITGIVLQPELGLLDRDSGHGTFIAGLIRQTCPDAKVLAIRVMPSDGVVDEHQLVIALNKLLVRQAEAQATGDHDNVIDVMSLSLGYYHEDPDDAEYSSVLAGTLRSFAELGVAVVAAAGNDHTTTPFFPAGFASQKEGADLSRDAVPLVSVGALNPNGTQALFSNSGQWVSAFRPGANVVSTLPTSFDGSAQPDIVVPGSGESVDMDDYTGGFGMWSGTSFSAPVLAGEIAACLQEQGGLEQVKATHMVARGWNAITATVQWDRPQP